MVEVQLRLGVCRLCSLGFRVPKRLKPQLYTKALQVDFLAEQKHSKVDAERVDLPTG